MHFRASCAKTRAEHSSSSKKNVLSWHQYSSQMSLSSFSFFRCKKVPGIGVIIINGLCTIWRCWLMPRWVFVSLQTKQGGLTIKYETTIVEMWEDGFDTIAYLSPLENQQKENANFLHRKRSDFITDASSDVCSDRKYETFAIWYPCYIFLLGCLSTKSGLHFMTLHMY